MSILFLCYLYSIFLQFLYYFVLFFMLFYGIYCMPLLDYFKAIFIYLGCSWYVFYYVTDCDLKTVWSAIEIYFQTADFNSV